MSNSATIAGTYSVTVTVKLTDYPTILTTQAYSLTLKHPCIVTTISTGTPAQTIGPIRF